MNWKDIGKTIASEGLPILGGLLGGKIGEKAGNMIAGVLGCEPTPESVTSSLENNPELYVELRKYEMEHKKELQALQIQETGMYLADVQNARQREVEVTKATGKRDWFLYALAIVVVIGFFSLMILFIVQPPIETTALIMLIGNMSSMTTMVVAYFFGSSKGSADKNAAMISRGKQNDTTV